LTAKLSNKHAL